MLIDRYIRKLKDYSRQLISTSSKTGRVPLATTGSEAGLASIPALRLLAPRNPGMNLLVSAVPASALMDSR